MTAPLEPPADADVRRALRRAWFPIARAGEITAAPRRIVLLGEPLAVFRGADGTVRAVADRCPHRGAALSLGHVDGEDIVCAYHGWRWRGSDGRCSHIPSIGDRADIPARAVATVHYCQERFDLVWCCLEKPAAPLYDPPELHGLDWAYAAGKPIVQRAGIRTATENFRDVAHFPFVHAKTMGHVPHVVEPLAVRREGTELWMTRDYVARGGREDLWHPMRFRYHAIAPAFVCLIFDSGPAGRRILLNAPSPIGADGCTVFWTEGITADFRAMSLEECLVEEAEVYEEDQPILDSIEPLEAPLDPAAQVHTPADRYTLEYRRAFVEFVRRATASSPRPNAVMPS